jgi:hypothetical protein
MKASMSYRIAPLWHVMKQNLRFAFVTVPLFTAGGGLAQTPPVYPDVGPTTHFIDQDAVIGGFPETGWFKANVPFIDLPDKTVENVYYYRFVGLLRR